MDNRLTALQRSAPVIGVLIIVVLMLTVWAADLYTSWRNIRETPVELPVPAPDIPNAKNVTRDKNGCVIRDGIKICDHPSYGLSPLSHHHHEDGHLCSFGASARFEGYTGALKPPRREAVKALEWIADNVGLSDNFLLASASFKKKVVAFATIRGKQRYIVYDEAVNFTEPKGQVSWFSLAVLSHEVAHHLAGHTAARNQPPHERELEADRFAGFMLGQLGASLHQAQAFTTIFSPKGSKSHPPRAQRFAAATQGWHQSQQRLRTPINNTNTRMPPAARAGGMQTRFTPPYAKRMAQRTLQAALSEKPKHPVIEAIDHD